VKVISHDATLSRKVDTLRESLVGISMQHPNVVRPLATETLLLFRTSWMLHAHSAGVLRAWPSSGCELGACGEGGLCMLTPACAQLTMT
jgi:hypothetical protein